MNKVRGDSRYKNIIKNVYVHATTQVKINKNLQPVKYSSKGESNKVIQYHQHVYSSNERPR